MLEALNRYDEKEATGLIAAAAQTLLPQPTATETSGEVVAFLREARTALRISETDQSARAASRLAVYLAKLLSERLLPKRDLSAARARLGAKGLLAPTQYQIQYNAVLTTRGSIFRVQWAHVVEAIQHADVVEHFRAVDSDARTPLVSLFLRRSPAKRANNFYWLIECFRDGFTLVPMRAWRLFMDVFDLPGVTPKEAITMFAEKFGNDLIVDNATHKIIFGQSVPIKTGTTTRLVDSSGLRVDILNTTNETEARVGFTYSIDNARYIRYLDDHHIREPNR